ncbi:hypothetical protein TVAG_336930 [Trichomonas vaginalis G3]|uniref:Protein kinase domain-containing protein n=1 Tax=Trichomonas vaginalis (strain ATCC PRA-98 / G3) TaxID=412133 RepID=A2EPW3_TRIV3|nr:hypothetical protein TVAGG3_0359740 [Trichomonas vaginalis G3]EAY05301.1 hypothetical protein TVAG_336930 [Trichomonas vaginalis G3]KAI5531866.1 hypothetical protein TVAGG3_0359740 [Trichomonas vaginalis G3]|eukprot:XP_001317524.1 hypothetical protein [Trichomonas vaginalis G3]
MIYDTTIRAKNIGTVYKTLKIIQDSTTESLNDRLLKESINKFDIMHNLTFILSRIQILHQSNIPYGFINELYITNDFKLQPLPLLYDIPAIFINSSRMELLSVPKQSFSLSHDVFDLGKLIYTLSKQGKVIYNNIEDNLISGTPFLIKELMNKDERQRPKLDDELVRRILYYFENR